MGRNEVVRQFDVIHKEVVAILLLRHHVEPLGVITAPFWLAVGLNLAIRAGMICQAGGVARKDPVLETCLQGVVFCTHWRPGPVEKRIYKSLIRAKTVRIKAAVVGLDHPLHLYDFAGSKGVDQAASVV
jgi:hypothetical protein